MYEERTHFALSTNLRSRYAAELLNDVQVAEGGIAHGHGPSRELLPWSRVLRVLAAEVGEPEGVRTVVFDLVVELGAERCRVNRFDADPGPDSQALARVIVNALGADRVSAAVKNAAADGYPSSWYPDLQAFEEAAVESLIPSKEWAES